MKTGGPRAQKASRVVEKKKAAVWFIVDVVKVGVEKPVRRHPLLYGHECADSVRRGEKGGNTASQIAGM